MKRSELQQIIREELAKASSKRVVTEAKNAPATKKLAKKVMDLLNDMKVLEMLEAQIDDKDKFWSALNIVERKLWELMK